jgi:hypothetical protein
MNPNLALAAAALMLVACSPDFDPASRIDKLRVVAVRADPPEIEPASVATVAPDRAALTSLVLRPEDFDPATAPTTTVVYLACVPIPGDPTPSPCVMLETLRDPTVAIASALQADCAGGGGGGPPPIGFAGVEVCRAATCAPAVGGGTPLPPPEVAVPAGFAFSAAGPERILGVQAIVLAFALDATPDELVAGAGTTCPLGDMAVRLSELWPAREHVLATKRVVIRGPEAVDSPNRNPAIDALVAGVTTLDAAAVTTIAGGALQLQPDVDAALQETYTELDAAGVAIETVREDWVFSWFSTAGELDELHTHGATPNEWRVTGAPGGTPAVVAAVVRDLRGGTQWAVRKVAVTP